MKKTSKFINVIYIIFLILIIIILKDYNNLDQKGKVVTLASCWDGDTAHFYIDNVDVKVRFIGIDTPEIDDDIGSMGNKASQYVCEILKNADLITLEEDPLSDKEDKFGRSLYWVWVDGKLLELEILKNGYGRVRYIYDDYLYVDELYEAQNYAKENNVGIWAD